ncbi:hypothetical protein IMPR6_40153 [Imperialibacter sp. EC-SDR9]|nr:hypothetical protein IMPERIA75_220122 [Imperialibacter sp. 75]CAD5260443.1 hypothetical protein IMPERIA89_280121 [Imperialibacter sp. 89]VVT25537.1 hypothetical protein IMPR6_40153 [Imperialibacter sp. EC-SDR9]
MFSLKNSELAVQSIVEVPTSGKTPQRKPRLIDKETFEGSIPPVTKVFASDFSL